MGYVTWTPTNTRVLGPGQEGSTSEELCAYWTSLITKPPSSIHNGRYWAKAIERLPSAHNLIRETQSQVECVDWWMCRNQLCSGSAWKSGGYSGDESNSEGLWIRIPKGAICPSFPHSPLQNVYYFSSPSSCPFSYPWSLSCTSLLTSHFLVPEGQHTLQDYPCSTYPWSPGDNMSYQHYPNLQIFIRCSVGHMTLWSKLGKIKQTQN